VSSNLSLIVLAGVLLLLAGCDSKGNSATLNQENGMLAHGEAPHFGYCTGPDGYFPVLSYRFVSGFSVRVGRDGVVSWNGIRVDDPTFREFVRRARQNPDQTAPVVLQTSNGADCAVVTSVRRTLADSGLCSVARCVEIPWELHPITYH